MYSRHTAAAPAKSPKQVNAACHWLPICERIARSLHDREIKVNSKVRKSWKRSLAYIEIGTPLSLSLQFIFVLEGNNEFHKQEKKVSLNNLSQHNPLWKHGSRMSTSKPIIKVQESLLHWNVDQKGKQSKNRDDSIILCQTRRKRAFLYS
jgi:hypothetical protein